MIDHQIVFNERYESEVYQTVTLYFTCPKEILFDVLKNEFPDAVSAELSIELPISDLEARYATVCISPTNEEGEDYDWSDISLPLEDIELLLKKAGQ